MIESKSFLRIGSEMDILKEQSSAHCKKFYMHQLTSINKFVKE